VSAPKRGRAQGEEASELLLTSQGTLRGNRPRPPVAYHRPRMTETPAQTLQEESKSFGDRLVSLIGFVFAIVLVQLFVLYRVVVLHPLGARDYVGTVALLVIYLTAFWSWIGWHRLMIIRPYLAIDARGRHVASEYRRFYVDLAIVMTYAYMLLEANAVTQNPARSLIWILVGYPVIFFLYGVSSILRRKSYGEATGQRLIRRRLAASVIVVAAYALAYGLGQPSGWHAGALNIATLVVMIVLVRSYWHFSRERWRDHVQRPQG
jgi:hypothetical protein